MSNLKKLIEDNKQLFVQASHDLMDQINTKCIHLAEDLGLSTEHDNFDDTEIVYDFIYTLIGKELIGFTDDIDIVLEDFDFKGR